ncbi:MULTISPECIES: baseplate J/gp47 family protein [unclassified Nostoc]|uniref:baseplate J/gp47 family protein n=1 Tax=unclassified Nostoc TaxID=2593658 RepID=UPI002AD1D8F7|nr:baseplate J/gp47 family protein [Nostoc sp. DedQUE03]MDZ7975646.1 baseplate J/gp47 family protein [Nostoc sp. DedQUE03]MDZ8047424.1 baseplate J/gp47 family protein [Nostoc sp. DedQUE02]
MASLPPKIDQRTYEEIVQQTENLVEQYTGWKAAPGNQTDAGGALIRIFGRMVKLVSDRLNQVPEKNFLAFLDLIGGELKPPQPAKVPLTFYLAQGSPTDALVPAYTQVSAPPAEGADEEIVFETDRELVVTTTQLQAVFLREPNQDKYSDLSEILSEERTLAATGQQDAAFLALEGDRSITHSLYITCPEIFTLPELKELQLIITTNNTVESVDQLQIPLNWSYWDGSQWQTIPTPSQSQNNNQSTITFTFGNLPIPAPYELQGKTAKWLQANLNNISSLLENLPQVTNIQGIINIKQSNLIPESCLFNTTSLDLTKDFYPFGEQPELNDTFYIALNDTFIKPNVTISIDINLTHKPININDLKIVWEIGNGQVWQEIADQNNQPKWIAQSSAIQFTEKDTIQAKLQFPNAENIPSPSTVNGETRYWVRARITQGHYGKAADERLYPVYDDLAVLRKEFKQGANEIEVDTLDLFKTGDAIRILPYTGGFPEENKITQIIKETNRLKLETGVLNTTLGVGTRIMRKLIITETIPPTYDPPLIKSLKLTYKFTLTEKAIYFAENDFTYSSPENLSSFQPFTSTIDREPTLYLGFDNSFNNKTVTLYAQFAAPLPNELSADITEKTVLVSTVNTGDKTLQIADITGWQTGDRLQIQNPLNAKQYDNYTIINISKNLVTTNQPLQQDYPQNTPVIRSQQPQLIWEYSSTLGWQALGVEDETQAFFQPGLIRFIAPADFSPGENFGKELYWLRVRWVSGNFRVKPRLRRLLTNTTWAVQAISLREEVLGSSNYDPNQVFIANNIPILMGQQLEIQEAQIPLNIESDRIKVIKDNLGEIDEVWVLWQEVADFYDSSASDRHYTLDRQTGEIRFGNGQVGMIPPRGRNNIRLSFYQTGGGKQGNVTAQTISQLKTTIPYIDRVINLEAAAGGAQQETLDRLKERVPKQLRHRDRAVTFEDIADLAYEASTDVARVKVVTPDLLTTDFSPLNEKLWLDPTKPNVLFEDILREKLQTINATEAENFEKMMREINRRAGQVKLMILPYSSDRQPTPSLALLKQVETYILSRCAGTVDLVVTAPKWREVTVTTTITPVLIEDADMLRNSVRQYLEAFLHPLTGGTGEGWQFGRYPQKSDFYAIIQSIAGVDHVNSLEVELPATESKSLLSADSLIYSGNHNVKVEGNRG